jgi:hypothetical protein
LAKALVASADAQAVLIAVNDNRRPYGDHFAGCGADNIDGRENRPEDSCLGLS